LPDRTGFEGLAPRPLPTPVNGPDIDLDSLRCFDAVATTLRFRSAAARVHLSPAAFSDRIGRLERVLGTRILQRTTRKVALTSAGERLLPVARRILGLVAHMPGTAIEESAPLRYELVVGTRYELGLSWLCGALDALERKHPERTIHLYNGSSEDLLAKIERGEIDAAVTSVRLGSPRFTYAALHQEEYLLVGTDRRLRGPEAAKRHTLVDISPDLPLFRYFLDALPDADPWPFGRVEYMGGIANVRQRLLGGEGRVGVLPTFFAKEDLAKRRLVRLMPRVPLGSDSLRLVWRPNHPRQAELLALAHDLREFPLR
jgi:DNA-binding transcriptional LysR family regulator